MSMQNETISFYRFGWTKTQVGSLLTVVTLAFAADPANAQDFTRTCTGDEAASARTISNQVTRFDPNDVLRINNAPDGAVISFSTRRNANGRPSGLRYTTSGNQSVSIPSLNTGIMSVGQTVSRVMTVGDDGTNAVDEGTINFSLAAVLNGNSSPSAIRQSWVITCTPPDIDIQSTEAGGATSVSDGSSDNHGPEPAGIPKTVEFIIRNTLGGTLRLDNPVTVTGLTNVTSATVTTQPPVTTLTSGQTTSFFVTYTPTNAGPFSFEIDVPNNDFAENNYDIEVVGSASGDPEIDISSSEGGAVADGGTDAQGTEVAGTAKIVTYTIENDGTDTLTLTGAPTVGSLTNITGTPTVGALSATSLAPGETATFTVTYTPTVAGPFSLAIEIPNDDADEGPYNITTSGTATGDAEIDVSSSEGGPVADGGTDAQGAEPAGTAKTVTYTISNPGTDTLTLSGTPTVSGAMNIDGTVTVSAPGSLSLAPGETTTFEVTYTPENAGAFGFDIDVTSDDADEGTYDVAVSGTATGDAEIDISSSEGGAVADGGTDAQGTEPAGTAKTVTYTIANTGTDTLTLSSTPTVSGATNIDGAVTVGAPASLSLAPGETTTFDVTYTPENAGAFDFDVDVLNDDADEATYDIAVSGTASGAPDIGVSSSESGAVADGGTDAQGSEVAGSAKTVTYTIENEGTDTLTLTGTPTVSGATNIDGTVTVSAPGSLSLAPGETTTFEVTYTPENAGAFGFEIDVLSDDADEGTYDVAVSGTATGDAEIDVSSSEGGAVTDGGTDAQGTEVAGTAKIVTYTIENDGTDTLTLTGTPTVGSLTNITGTPTVGALSATSLAPGETATFTVTYTPTVAGPFSLAIEIPNDDTDEGPYNITTSGTATGDAEIDVSSSEGGPVADGGTDAQGSEVAGTPKTVTYTIENEGNDTLALTGAPTVGGLTNVNGSVMIGALSATSLAPGETATFEVTYTPTVAGPFSFDLAAPNDDADEGPYNITTSGTATGAADIGVSSSEGGAVADGGTDAQGSEPAGTAKTVTYTIENEGTDTLTLSGTPTVSGASNIDGLVAVSAPGSLSLAPGETTTFTVTYTPENAGAFGFDVDVASNDDDESTYDIAVSGTASGDAEISVSSSEGGAVADGGTDAQGTEPAGTPKTVTYTIENEGTDTLELTGVPTATGLTNIDSPVSIGSLSATSLAPGETATFEVTYTPTIAGPFSFDLTIPNDDADEGPYNITTSGTAAGDPEIAVSSSEGGPVTDGGIDAQGTEPSGVAKTVTYTIANEGLDTLNLNGTPTVDNLTNITGTPTFGALSATSLAPGETATFTVTYTPTIAGPFSLAIEVPNDDADEGPYNIITSGTATGDPEIAVSSSEGGPVTDGGTDAQGSEPAGVAKTVTYTIENEGTDTLTLTGVPAVSGLTNITGTPTIGALSATSLAPGETATFTVTYTPTIAGPFSLALEVPNDDPDEGPFNITTSGTATGAAEIAISSSEGGAITDGGTDAQGTEPAGTPKTVTYTIENEGTDTLELTGLPTVSGLVNIDDPVAIGTLSATSLAPGETATFTVTYTPTIAGPFSFELEVPNDDADEGPFNIMTTGTAAGDADIAVSSSESGAVTDGGTDDQGREPAGVPKTVTYTIENEGLDTLTLTGTPTVSGLVNVEDPVVVSAPGSLSLAPGEMTTFTVTYTPIAEGPASFDLDILSNDPDEGVFDVAVSASGNAAPTAVLTGPTGAQSGPFTVTVTFSEPVDGLELTDFVIGNGTPSALTMTAPGGYTILVTPTTPGVDVTVSLPANTVMDMEGVMNPASNVLTLGSGALTEEEKEVIRDIIVSETVNTLRADIAANQRAMWAARDRFASVQRCRVLEDQFENNQIPLERLEAECESDLASRNVPLSFDGSLQATQDSTNIIGSFFGQRTSIDGDRSRIISGEFDVTRVEDDDREDETVTASLIGRVAWERLVSEDVLFGYFIGGNASQSEISGSFSGTRTGFGLSTGAYFVDQLDENLFWDGFIAVGAGQNNLELDNGTLDVESDYTTTSAQIGFAVSGIKEFERFEVRPELSVAYGYADIGNVDLEVSTDTSSLTDALEAGDVAFGKISFAPEFFIPVGGQSGQFETSELRVAPSLSCEYLRTTADTEECGGGLEFEWSASSEDRLTEFSARIGREVIGDQTRDSIGLQFERNF